MKTLSVAARVVWIGSLGRLGGEALSGSAASSFRVALNVVGLAATAAVTVLATRMARAALARAAPRIGATATAAAESH